MTTIIPCMGGFKCAVRDSCAHFHAEDRSSPSESLCAKGEFNAYTAIAEKRERIKQVARSEIGSPDPLTADWAHAILRANP